jgi:ring-1,2-phenylacetyl-CoA epoxidase subunit PaaE
MVSIRFHKLSIAAIKLETADAISVQFAIPEVLQKVFAFKPGQHVTIRSEIAGQEVRRNYSLCAAPHENIFKIAIKRITGGTFSSWALDALKPGMFLETMPPHGSFTLERSSQKNARYVGIAGGSGITPVLSHLKAILAEEADSHFTLIYGNRDSNSVIFLEELWALKNRYIDRLSLIHVLSDEIDDFELHNGLLNRAKCDDLFQTIADIDAVRAFLICGPGAMMDAAEAALRECGVAKERILIERFTVDRPSAAQSEVLAAQMARVVGSQMQVTLDGRTRVIAFDPNAGNILDNIRANGLSAPYACKAGVCATCRARLVSGKVTMSARFGLSDDDIAKGYILTCQAIPDSDGVSVNFDQ